jgi:hypothetical protein
MSAWPRFRQQRLVEEERDSSLFITNLPRKWESIADVHNVTIHRDKKEFDKALKTYFLKNLKAHVKCENPFCPSCIINVIPIVNLVS